MKTIRFGAVAASLLLASGMSGFAAEPQGWQVEITPYAWLAGFEGDATVDGNKVDFDKKFSDIVDAVDLAGSLLTVVQFDRFLVWGQMDYFSTDTSKLDIEDQPQGGSLDTKTFLGELAVGYQLDGWMENQTFDVLVGVRTLQIENDLTIYGREGQVSKDTDVVDPILVLRPSMQVLPSKIDGLRFNPTLAIGGGGDSELTYELFPQFQYQFTENVAARVGYRTVGYKFEGDNNDNELNVNLAGLIVGVGMTF